ncbi:gliding motility lipoprotein GldH [Lutibacter sp.]|uniref:gliding motility lipoprotein GldH n=1 Tax=Lutibacter sp. TaxID=1925666 RepID=UPI0025C4E5EA|nr:gliding motility lipoprotein GldH [Lutibacter sp.]MCF6181438.1 gliding motility lipoprotein GldH [Lutibacter sp.]
MKKTVKKFKVYIFFFLALISCNSKTIFNKYQSLPNKTWFLNNKIVFNIENKDTINNKNVFINIRNTTNYPFSSLFLIAKIETPTNNQIIDTLEYKMADNYGNWLGTGISNIKENKLIYKQNYHFSKQGNYKFTIQQATRSNSDIDGNMPLKGISDVGLSIEKIKE